MNPESENRESLRHLMREWTVNDPLPPRFQEGVWRRIQQSETSPSRPAAWERVQAWLAAVRIRPAFALVYVSVLLVAGMAGGYWQALERTAQLDRELGRRYVQSVDPYQKPPRM